MILCDAFQPRFANKTNDTLIECGPNVEAPSFELTYIKFKSLFEIMNKRSRSYVYVKDMITKCGK